MDRVGQILRALFRRALSEHGRDAPALTDIIVEAAAEPVLWVEFSNGYRTSAPLPANDCFAFCERHAVWDLAGLRRALRVEAHRIYTRMLQDHLVELGRERRAWLAEQMRRLGHGFSRNFRPQRRAGVRLFADEGSTEAQERGIRLLKENLTPEQRQQYEKHWYFEVVGGKTGKRYRIRHGRSMNIDQLDKNGRRVCGWCFFPRGALVTGDVMLAQKLSLELFEAEALMIANKMW